MPFSTLIRWALAWPSPQASRHPLCQPPAPLPPQPACPPADAKAAGAPGLEASVATASPLEQLFRLHHSPCTRSDEREAAARVVMQRHGPAMRDSYARRWRCSPEDVEDCLQDTMLRFLFHTRADCRQPEAMFHRIFIHRLVDNRRRRADPRWQSLDALLDEPGGTEPVSLELLSDPYQALLLKETSRYLHGALRASSPGRAQVLALLLQGASNDEIAARLCLTPGAARERVHRVRLLVRAIFTDEP